MALSLPAPNRRYGGTQRTKIIKAHSLTHDFGPLRWGSPFGILLREHVSVPRRLHKHFVHSHFLRVASPARVDRPGPDAESPDGQEECQRQREAARVGHLEGCWSREGEGACYRRRSAAHTGGDGPLARAPQIGPGGRAGRDEGVRAFVCVSVCAGRSW